MYPVSSRFIQSLKSSNIQLASKFELLQDGVVEYTVDTVTDGTIGIDRSADIRRRCTLYGTAPREDFSDDWLGLQDFFPYGNEVRVWLGLQFWDGTQELIPQGVFVIQDLTLEESEGMNMRIDGLDRSLRVQENKFAQTRVIPVGASIPDVIRDIVEENVPWCKFISQVPFGFELQPLTFNAGSDPWKACLDMAASMGAELFFDQLGNCVLRPEPNTDVLESVWNYVEGEDATILASGRKITRQGVANHTIVVGEHPNVQFPSRGEAVDDNPFSPTYIGVPWGSSRFGDVVDFSQTTLVSSSIQAQSAAEARLAKLKGITEQINFPTVVNPAHQEADAVLIQTSKNQTNNTYVLDQLTMPLVARNSLQCQTRLRQIQP